MRIDRTAAAALVGAAAVLVGGGTALAGQAADEDKRAARCEERLARIAERRGVSVAELRADIQARLTARIDAALAAGRITAEQAAKRKERVAAGAVCKRAGAARAKLATRGLLKAAADFLGMTRAELREELEGTSLGALAEVEGKSETTLEAAMLAPAKARLAKAVAAGRITQAKADEALAKLATRVDRLVAKVFPAG
jgi:hypothetical protein